MLRSELRDQDIPHRTTIRKRVMEVWDEHLDTLERELGVHFYFLVLPLVSQENLGGDLQNLSHDGLVD